MHAHVLYRVHVQYDSGLCSRFKQLSSPRSDYLMCGDACTSHVQVIGIATDDPLAVKLNDIDDVERYDMYGCSQSTATLIKRGRYTHTSN